MTRLSTLMLAFAVALLALSACEDEPPEGVEPPLDDETGFLETPASYANVYLVRTNPEPTIANAESIGCGDVLVPLTIPVRRNDLTGTLSALFQQSDTLGLQNVLYRDEALRIDSVRTARALARIYISGDLTIGGVCDHPRIIGQLQATARSASTADSLAFFIGGEPLEAYLSLRE